MTYLAVDELTRELHDAVVDLSKVQQDRNLLTLTGSRVEYRRKGMFSIRKRVEFKLRFHGVESFTLDDEALVGTLPISHFARDEDSQLTTVVGNIPVSIAVHTAESGATLVVSSSELAG